MRPGGRNNTSPIDSWGVQVDCKMASRYHTLSIMCCDCKMDPETVTDFYRERVPSAPHLPSTRFMYPHRPLWPFF